MDIEGVVHHGSNQDDGDRSECEEERDCKRRKYNEDSEKNDALNPETFILHMMEEFPALAEDFSQLFEMFNLNSNDPVTTSKLADLILSTSDSLLHSSMMQELAGFVSGMNLTKFEPQVHERYGIFIPNLHSLLLNLSLILGAATYSKLLKEYCTNYPFFGRALSFYSNLIVGTLGHSGQFTPEVLSLFRTLPVLFLNLSPSFQASENLLEILSLPSSFVQLRTLNLSGARIKNEALVHLLPLRSLLELNISDNPSVDNESLPLLHKFPLLQSLDIRGTSITLEGRKNPYPCPSFGLRNFITRSKLLQPNLRSISPPLFLFLPSSSLNVQSLPDSSVSHPDQIHTLTKAAQLKKLILRLDPEADVSVRSPTLRKRLSLLLWRRIDNMRCLELLNLEGFKK